MPRWPCCTRLGDRDGAASAFADLGFAPFTDRLVVIDRALLCLGTVSRILGLLAATLGDDDVAVRHLSHAIAKHDELGFLPLAARARADLAAVLARAGEPRVVVSELVDEATRTAQALGMTRLLKRLDALPNR